MENIFAQTECGPTPQFISVNSDGNEFEFVVRPQGDLTGQLTISIRIDKSSAKKLADSIARKLVTG